MVQEAYIQGVSTRSVDDLVKALGMTGTSKSQVSRLCEEIDGKVKAFPHPRTGSRRFRARFARSGLAMLLGAASEAGIFSQFATFDVLKIRHGPLVYKPTWGHMPP